MTTHFTIGIEEEFQTVDRSTGQLCGRIQQILEKGRPIFGERIKAEMLRPTVELNSSILPDISTARKETAVKEVMPMTAAPSYYVVFGIIMSYIFR